jgi:hypothetical protein
LLRILHDTHDVGRDPSRLTSMWPCHTYRTFVSATPHTHRTFTRTARSSVTFHTHRTFVSDTDDRVSLTNVRCAWSVVGDEESVILCGRDVVVR